MAGVPEGMARSAEPPGAVATYFELTRDLAVSLTLVLPRRVAYQAGLFLLGYRVINGADFVTRLIYPEFGLKGLVLFNLSVVAAFLAAIIRLERRRRFSAGLFPPLVVESAIYAAALGSVIVFLLRKAWILSIPAGSAEQVARALVMSIGAGVNEEIVFRLVLLAVLEYALADLAGLSDRTATALAVVLGALLFSGAHYVGAHGDRLEVASFAYRAVAGVIFAVIYRWRSFAVAVYTHAIYDVIVLVR